MELLREWIMSLMAVSLLAALVQSLVGGGALRRAADFICALALLAALPFVIIALVYAFMAKKTYYQLGALPSFMEGMLQQDEFAGALNYYTQRPPLAAADVLRALVRGMCMPMMTIVKLLGDDALLIAERLAALFLLIPPVCYGLGYLTGPSIRTKINTGIKIGVEKKLKKQRKERRKRQKSNTPERLI